MSFAHTPRNPILDTDSYKLSHYLQFPPGLEETTYYLEARAGAAHDSTVFFGLQYLLKAYLAQPITMEHVDEAAAIAEAHGEPFNRAGFERIVTKHGGRWPVEIRAAYEGARIPAGHVMMTVRSTDPELAWVPSYIETMLMRVWYPCTVATVSHAAKTTIRAALEKSCMDPEAALPFKLHDFGARGVSSRESAGIGGLAHLVNFLGTDTLEAIVYGRRYYGEHMAGLSIPAAEHSSIILWGKDNELSAYQNMVDTFAQKDRIVAVVSDSYDLDHAVTQHFGQTLRAQIEESGATVVVRPDSGDPKTVVLRTLDNLAAAFGTETNAKGYKVLPPCIRVIQGDGVNLDSIAQILDAMLEAGYSAENVAFGMGGGLLQKVNRDTQRFAFKCSSAVVNGVRRDVQKMPKTDPSKASKPGVLDLEYTDAGYRTVRLDGPGGVRAPSADSALHTVYRDGEVLSKHTLGGIRERAKY